MKRNRRKLGRGAMELIEEAVHLLRLNGAAAVVPYYVGSLPFVLGFLYFWSDMSRSPFAASELPGAALGLALLFLWMKFWQAVFLEGLRARISAQPATSWTFRRCLRVLVVQTAIQPSAGVLLPLAVLALVVPFGWVYAFYQNITALAGDDTGELGKLFKRARKLAFLWPKQNYSIIAILLGFGFYVFVNLFMAGLLLPRLLKMLFGIDSLYSQSPMSMFNTTVLTAIFALTWLCMDPIVKTVYLLRCFYGESLQSGEDLKVELKQLTPFAAKAAVVMLAFVLMCANCNAAGSPSAVTNAPSSPTLKTAPPSIPAPTLDKTINDVLQQPKYIWRLPREKIVQETRQNGPISRFFDTVFTWLKHITKNAWNWVDKWLRKLFGGRPAPSGNSNVNWTGSPQALQFVLIIAVASVLVILLIRLWQKKSRGAQILSSEPIASQPDLQDENVGADQLPEDGWIKLGRELLSNGELRLALRAFYFASLSHLAARSLITIAKFKSNRDYETELRRRGHSLPDMLSLFGQNVLVFDRVWYGLHDVDRDVVGNFLFNVEKIKAAA